MYLFISIKNEWMSVVFKLQKKNFLKSEYQSMHATHILVLFLKNLIYWVEGTLRSLFIKLIVSS